MTTHLYHITHYENLKTIIKEGGLWCEAKRAERDIGCINIAYITLKDRRSRRSVSCGPGGTLSDYVPFYFAPRSPMLYVINKGQVEGYQGGEEPVVHLVTTIEKVQQASLPFVFTDGHAVMTISSFFEDLDDLRYIDWEVMKSKYWNDTPQYPDRSRRRQAEFLVHQFVPWDLFIGVGARTPEISKLVNEILSDAHHKPPVKEKRDWYYD